MVHTDNIQSSSWRYRTGAGADFQPIPANSLLQLLCMDCGYAGVFILDPDIRRAVTQYQPSGHALDIEQDQWSVLVVSLPHVINNTSRLALLAMWVLTAPLLCIPALILTMLPYPKRRLVMDAHSIKVQEEHGKKGWLTVQTVSLDAIHSVRRVQTPDRTHKGSMVFDLCFTIDAPGAGLSDRYLERIWLRQDEIAWLETQIRQRLSHVNPKQERLPPLPESLQKMRT